MTRVELDNKLRRYADAQIRADNSGPDEEWAPLSDAATALAVEILNEFERTTAERDRLRTEVRRTRPVYVRAMRYCRLLDGWNPEYDPDGDRHGNALCWLEDACRWARRAEATAEDDYNGWSIGAINTVRRLRDQLSDATQSYSLANDIIAEALGGPETSPEYDMELAHPVWANKAATAIARLSAEVARLTSKEAFRMSESNAREVEG